jgi:hypothetical protein
MQQRRSSRRPGRRRTVITGTVLALVMAASPAGAASWTVIPSPNPSTFDSVLWGVDALSAGSAWAVGAGGHTTDPTQRPMIQRWNGTSWSMTATPTPSSGGQLRDVDAVSATSAWAVGFAPTSNGDNTLIERWTGSTWSIVPSPNRSTLNYLMSVKAFSANDAWAVGDNNVPGTLRFQTLVQRWNGTRWSIVASPSPDPVESHLLDIDGVSSSDLWAVGYTLNDPYGVQQSLILHYNGSAWTQVAAPVAREASLDGVVALASNNVWAVGFEFSLDMLRQIPYALHWDGLAWRKVTVPTIAPDGGRLYDVAGSSSSNVYAVGNAPSSSGIRTLVMRWNGTKWAVESTPTPATACYLWDATAVSGTVFAVGQRQQLQGGSLGASRTLVLRGQTGNLGG